MKIHIERDVLARSMKFYFYQKKEFNKIAVAKPIKLTFETMDDGTAVNEPTMEISEVFGNNIFQEMVDSLYEQGFIPSQLSEQHKQATEILEVKDAHLEDMRKLVFKE